MKKQMLLIFTIVLMLCAISAEAKGKKYGLFVGVNKYPAPNQLAGCENDAKQMQKTLATKYGFKLADTTILLSAAATRQAIIDKMKFYAGKASAGDIFVMHYSGHGSLFPDSMSEEQDETEETFFDDPSTDGVDIPKDKYDSTILPVDFNKYTSGKGWGNMILDDELYAMFAEFTKKGVQVVFISDSCHSGGISRGKSKGKTRFLSPLRVFKVKKFDDLKIKKPATTRNVTDRSMNELYIVLSASNVNELALDGEPKKLQMGLFSENLVAALKKPAALKMTYTELMEKVSGEVSNTASTKFDHDQNPRLEDRFGKVDAVIFSAPK